MGEIADDYIEGRCCTGCMTYFEAEHGYPVLCDECWDDPEQDRGNCQRAHLPLMFPEDEDE